VLPQPAVQLRGVGFAYPGAPLLFRGAELSVDGGSRVVLLGEHGTGMPPLVPLRLGPVA
jgi:ATPase subunit of ABC transporter with duplicated ATPase domains